MGVYKEKIENRGLEAYHIIVASFLSGFSEIGVLNQAVVNNLVKKMAERLAIWFRTKGMDPGIRPGDGLGERLRKTILFLNTSLNLAEEVKVGNTMVGQAVVITSNLCRICPVGVGEAEIPGTACPYPTLIQSITNLFSPDGKEVRVKVHDYNVLTKKSGKCFIFFEG